MSFLRLQLKWSAFSLKRKYIFRFLYYFDMRIFCTQDVISALFFISYQFSIRKYEVLMCVVRLVGVIFHLIFKFVYFLHVRCYSVVYDLNWCHYLYLMLFLSVRFFFKIAIFVPRSSAEGTAYYLTGARRPICTKCSL